MYRISLYAVLLFSLGCASVPTVPKFEDSNAFLVKKSIERIPIIDSLSKYIDVNDNIALVSIEDPETKDTAISSLIEDVFLKRFLAEGYKVLERDNDLIYRLMSECDSTYVHKYQIKKEALLSSGSVAYDYLSWGLPYRWTREGVISKEMERPDGQDYSTSLMSADKLIAYRVLECGVVYEASGYGVKEDSLKRIANTMLMVRAEDAKSGRILGIFPLRGTVQDKISSESRELQENYHFRHYRFGYPKVYGNPEQVEYRTKNVEEKKSAYSELLVAGGVLFGVIALLGILSAR